MWHFLISPIFHTMVQKYRNQAEVSLGLEVSVRLLLIPEPKRGALLLLIWYDTVTCERQQTIRNSQRKTGVCLHVEFSATARDASHRTYPSHRSFPDGSATSCPRPGSSRQVLPAPLIICMNSWPEETFRRRYGLPGLGERERENEDERSPS